MRYKFLITNLSITSALSNCTCLFSTNKRQGQDENGCHGALSEYTSHQETVNKLFTVKYTC